ncbi:ABC transporter permease [Terracidiphilus gabretensis]|uniref:ABC transporter permease n=1 Tax=Terracidiphilus gabretensis TaxID=1577687 RepID=UPI00071B35A7|nr:ABC transporter permease [Terracidiphilus gabretensis]
MSLRSRIATLWKALTRPEEFHREMTEELSFHIEQRAEDLMRGGVLREDALRRARIELGGIPAQTETMRAAWGTRMWDDLYADIRYALRSFARTPGLTAIAVISLALGIGANTVIFGVTKHILLDRLTAYKPEELRLFAWISPKKSAVHSSWGMSTRTPDGKRLSTSFTYPVYQQLRRQNRVFDDVFAFKEFPRLTATIDAQSEAVSAQMVSGNFYRTLGVQPVLGRPILDSDDGASGSGPVAVISDEFWTRRFGRSPGVVGKTIQLNLTPITIIGVNPRGFTGASSTQEAPDVIIPFSMASIATPVWSKKPLLTDPDLWWVPVMGRVKPGVSDEQARAALDVVLNAAVRSTATIGKDETVPSLILQDGSRGENYASVLFSKPAYVLMALAGFVLLLACANLANLLLARASSRQREMSVRLAMGAGRSRILRQMLTESLLLSCAGGLAGLGLGYCGRNMIPHLLSSSWHAFTSDIEFDWKIFGFTAAISILTGLLFGLAPAWHASRTQVSSGLKDNAQSVTQRSRNVTGKTLVVVQVALSMLLLVGAGLFVRTLMNLNGSHLGFRPDGILLFNLQPPRTRYSEPKDLAFYHRVEERLRSVPGVSAVTLSDMTLIANSNSDTDFTPDGLPKKPNEEDQSANVMSVGQDFFSTMGIRILAGRAFNATDTETSPLVAIVNQTLVKEFFPSNINPVGRTFTQDKQHITIVGIAGDAKYSNLHADPPATFYLPYRQQLSGKQSMTYEISTRMKPAAIVPALRSAVASVDKDVPLLDVRTQQEQIDDTTKQQRIFASLTSGFGVLALILACIGIYGIMAYSISRRTNEIGIRMALGAQPGRVQRMVLREAWWMALIGVAAGLGAALAMGRLIASMLYGLKPWDPVTLGVAALLLVAVALAASWVPALRAASVEPMEALRHE